MKALSLKGFGMFAMMIVLVGNVMALSDDQRSAIEQRIALKGSVCVEGDSECAVAAAPAASDGPRSGEDIFNASCMACHSTGAAGAPKLGDTAAWADRLAKGVDGLTKTAISGINGMPPRGTCASCSDDDIKAAVEYIVNASK